MRDYFISVTGFKTAAELRKLKPPRKRTHDIFCGVLVRAGGGEGGRYAPRKHVPELVQAVHARAAEGFVPVAHFVVPRATSRDDVERDLRWLAKVGFGAVQVNCLGLDLLKHICNLCSKPGLRKLELIIQINKTLMSKGILGAALRAEELRRVADREFVFCLLDESGGHGVALDRGKAREFIEACRLGFPSLRPGLAGGLSETTAEGIAADFGPWVSLDAEGALQGLSGIDVGAANRYLAAAARGISRWKNFLDFEMTYREGGGDFAKNGQKLHAVVLGDGSEVDFSQLRPFAVPFLAFRLTIDRDAVRETVREELAVRDDAPPPVKVRYLDADVYDPVDHHLRRSGCEEEIVARVAQDTFSNKR